MHDALVIGSGPAGLAMAAALCEQGLRVQGISPTPPTEPWPNTYGIWVDEAAPLGLSACLGHRWQDTTAHVAGCEIQLRREYALFDNPTLQAHLLHRCHSGEISWHLQPAKGLQHHPRHSVVTCTDGTQLAARVVVDASGHNSVFVQRPPAVDVAYQAAYGLVGTFSRPPVRDGQMMLMDYRADHLSAEERLGPITFLYAMDLGDGRHFAEETSLAHVPGLPLDLLADRLERRLAKRDIRVEEVHHVERCFFPMNMPLPNLTQPVLGFGGAAGLVHPASGYSVGASLRRAPQVAQVLAQAILDDRLSPWEIACSGWRALWPTDALRRYHLYLFGLRNVLDFDEAQNHDFFATFFTLPYPQWTGYLSNTLSTPQLVRTMLVLFARAPGHVRQGLMRSLGTQPSLLWRALRG